VLILQPSFYLHDERGLIKRRNKLCFAPALVSPYLASFFPARECQVELRDEIIHDIDFAASYDLVAISYSTGQAQRAYEIANAFRDNGCAVALGGYHASACPEEALEHADAVVVGEFESVADRFVDDFLGQGIRGLYRSQQPFSMEHMRMPRYELIDWPKFSTPFFSKFPVETSRGCPHRCDFCCIHTVHGHKIRFRPVTEVLEEIDRITTDFRRLRPTVFFTDENMGPHFERNYQLLEGLASRTITWSVFLSVETCNHPEYVALAARAGCTGAVIGFETVDEANLRSVHKTANRIEDYYRAAELFRRNRIPVYASIMAGFPNDDESTLKSIVDFLNKARIPFAFFYPVYPFPGTELYMRMRDEGQLTDSQFWLKVHNIYDIVRLRNFARNGQRFEDAFRRMTARYYSPGGMLRRSMGSGCFVRVLVENLGLGRLYSRYDSYATI
jgi:radical SAM superfamily enzyme YgiQ (UPF0313 family)